MFKKCNIQLKFYTKMSQKQKINNKFLRKYII